jgi:hypothetical protein
MILEIERGSTRSHYPGLELPSTTQYFMKDKRNDERDGDEEEEVSSYWITLRKGDDTVN